MQIDERSPEPPLSRVIPISRTAEDIERFSVAMYAKLGTGASKDRKRDYGTKHGTSTQDTFLRTALPFHHTVLHLAHKIFHKLITFIAI